MFLVNFKDLVFWCICIVIFFIKTFKKRTYFFIANSKNLNKTIIYIQFFFFFTSRKPFQICTMLIDINILHWTDISGSDLSRAYVDERQSSQLVSVSLSLQDCPGELPCPQLLLLMMAESLNAEFLVFSLLLHQWCFCTDLSMGERGGKPQLWFSECKSFE